MPPTSSRRPVPVLALEGVSALQGADHAEALLAAVEHATRRLWWSMFLVGLDPVADVDGRVRELLHAVVRAAARGVDVRVLVDDFRTSPDRIDVNLAAVRYLDGRQVPVRRYAPPTDRASHSKLVLVDGDLAIVGSGNLTPGGLGHNDELAVRVRSVDACRDLAERFRRGWDEAAPLVLP